MDTVRIELRLYGNGSIKTSWYKVPGAVRYHAYMTQSGKSGYLYNNQNLTVNCFVSPDRLPTNKDFRMYVDAYNSAGTKIASENSYMKITSYTYDPKKVPNNVPELRGMTPPSIQSKSATQTSATITWYAQSNATGYRMKFDNRVYELTGTSKTFTGLSPNRSYTFMMLTKTLDGDSAYGAAQTVTTPPVAPSNISAVSTTDTVTVSWNKVAGATKYTISFNNRIYTASGSSTSLKISGLQPWTSYNYKICCHSADGAGNYSSVKNIMTQQKPQAPKVPANIKKSATPSSATISWGAVSGATGYDLKFNGSVYSQTGTSKTISGLQPDTTYRFQVRAKNAAGTSAYSTEQTVRTTTRTPSNITKRSTESSVTISWSPVSGATGYDLLIDNRNYSQKETTRTLTGLGRNTAHKFQVRSKNANGVSPYSPEQTVTTAPYVPNVDAPQSSTYDTATVSWYSEQGATGYDVKFDGTVYSVPSNQTSKKITGLKPKTTYKYQVRAKNADGASAYSKEKSITTQKRLPDMPTNITATSTDKSVEIKWDKAPYATGYEVQFNGSSSSVTENSKKYEYLRSNTNYAYSVRSQNADGYSAYTPNKGILTAPSAPSNIKAVTDEDSVSLSWDASRGATGYEVEVDGRKYNTTANSYKATGLTPNTDHNCSVRAKNNGGTSTPSAVKKAKTTPKAPASPSATATKNSVTVSWPSVSGATGYDLLFDGKKYSTSNTSQRVDRLSPGTSHTYAVSSKNADGVSRYSPTKSISTVPNAPERPSDVSATATKNSVTVSWKAVSGATDYDLIFNGTTYHVTGTSKTITGLPENTRYSYKIRANNAGGSSAYTWDKYITTLMTPPAVPTNVRASATHDAATVSWSPAARATKYQLVFNGANYSVATHFS